MAVVASCAATVDPRREELQVGSGCVVGSDDSYIGCGSCFNVSIISWKDCDTLSKKIGFLFGRCLKFVHFCSSKTLNGLVRVIKALRIDKAYNLFCKTLRKVSERLSYITSRISDFVRSFFNKYIKPIFVNKFTKKIADCLSEKFGKYFKTKKVTHRSSGYENSKLAKALNRCFAFLRKIFKPIADWTVVPFNNRVLVPIGTFISNIALGTVGGCLNETKKVEKQPRTVA